METILPRQDKLELSTDPFYDVKEDGITVQIGADRIEISTSDNAHFVADVDSDRIVHLNILTTISEKKKHPYFERHKASELARRAISYFDQFGIVRGIAFDWGKPSRYGSSDNYTDYINTRDKLKKSVGYDEAKRLAAFSTWTFGQVAIPMKFTQLSSVEETGNISNPDSVYGTVYREQIVKKEV